MNQRQLERFKSALQGGDDKRASAQLDDKILRSARLKARQHAERNESRLFSASISFTGKALASVALTLCVFLGMSAAVKVDETRVPIAQETDLDQVFARRPLEVNIIAPTLPQIERPTKPELLQDDDDNLRDLVLAELGVPSAEMVLASMEFPLARDRQRADIALSSALDEIDSMVQIGELDFARERYQRLRQACAVCQLPGTLEALALVSAKHRGRI